MEIQNKSNLSNFPNKEKEVVLEPDGSILHNQYNNNFLTTNELTLGGLRFYLNFKFNSLRFAGNNAGLSYGRMRQLVTGKYLPSKAELIKQLSTAWDIDPIKLTILFERMREK